MCCWQGKKEGRQKSEDVRDKPQDCPHGQVSRRNQESLGPSSAGADVLRASTCRPSRLPLVLDFAMLGTFCALLFAVSLRNIRRKWIK